MSIDLTIPYGMSSVGLRQHYPCRHAGGTVEHSGRFAIRCRFDSITFAIIRSRAERDNVSFAEQVRRLVALGLESEVTS